MPKRRNQIQMNPDEIWKFIEERKSLQVATIGADGAPHLTTLWFVIVDGEIAFETFTKSQKIVNLKRDPRIAVLVEDGVKYNDLVKVIDVCNLKDSNNQSILFPDVAVSAVG